MKSAPRILDWILNWVLHNVTAKSGRTWQLSVPCSLWVIPISARPKAETTPKTSKIERKAFTSPWMLFEAARIRRILEGQFCLFCQVVSMSLSCCKNVNGKVCLKIFRTRRLENSIVNNVFFIFRINQRRKHEGRLKRSNSMPGNFVKILEK